MRSDNKSNRIAPRVPTQSLGLISLTILLAILVGFCSMPVEPAWGVIRERPNDQQQNRGVDPVPYTRNQEGEPYNASGTFVIGQIDYVFTDEASGATISHTSAPDSGEYAPPDVQALQVERGEAALHAEGTCAACDELRVKFRTGEIDALYRVSIVPDIAADDEFTLSVPLDREMRAYAVSRCAGSELDVTYSPKFAGSNASSRTHSTASIWGSLGDLQSPFGIAYDATRPGESSAVQSNSSDGGSAGISRLPPAQTPDNDDGDGDDDDDDDDDDEEDSNTSPLLYLISFAILALLVGAYFIPSNSKR